MNSWGRNYKPSFTDKLTVILMLIFCPLIALLFFVVNYGAFKGSLDSFFKEIFQSNFSNLIDALPKFNLEVFMYCLAWILFQILLASIPDKVGSIIKCYKGGICKGQTTPAGHILKYQVNGLQAWIITHILFLFLCKFELISPTIIIENFGSIFFSANIIGFIVSIFSYIKALNFSTHPEDNKYSKNFCYDFVMGIEFNPRICGLDLKLFFNGRPGIIAWTIINLSYSFQQYKNFGFVSDSMILVNILQGIYVLDFFWNENWYLRTIDIAHDHFGWMLGWADLAWLPFMYTLQGGYLMNNPVNLGIPMFSLILIFGLIGYLIFRIANYQKDTFKSDPNPIGYKFIPSIYETKDGKKHESRLLYSGLWGWGRHLNYTGDVILSLAYCLACGFNNILPYFYSIFMIILLYTRCLRDEDKMKEKHREKWRAYCKIVPYRFIPSIF